jgi:hypothetical protein
MIETLKPVTELPTAELDRMQRETDAIVARSKKLIAELEELLETGRQLRAAQAALLEQRNKKRT